MAIRASFKVDGIRETRKRIDSVGQRARRPEPALRSGFTKRDVTASERRRFSHNRGWRRLQPSWVQEKRRRGLDPRILRATGQLERALTTGNGMTFRAYNGVLFWGIPRGRSDLFYAQALAKGTNGKRGRRMVVIDKDAKGRISRRVESYIAHGWMVR